jgi:monothiol glutaredoxin
MRYHISLAHGSVPTVSGFIGKYFMHIIIYTKTGCPWCEGALALLREKNVPFEEREVRGNKEYFDEMVAKSGQSKAPTLDIDGFILADTDRDQIAAYLKEKGVAGF